MEETSDLEVLRAVRRFQSIHGRASIVLVRKLIHIPERMHDDALRCERNGDLEKAAAYLNQAEALLLALLRSHEARYRMRIKATES
jgi:hypothetical protein